MQLQDVEVDLVVELGKGRITGRELLQIKTNDTLVLNQNVKEPLLIRVEGVPKYRGYAGTLKGTHVVKLYEDIDPSYL